MKKLHLKLALAITCVVILWAGSVGVANAINGGISVQGRWVPSSDNSGCSIQEVCVQFCLVASDGQEIPTGNFCCFPANSKLPNEFGACPSLRAP